MKSNLSWNSVSTSSLEQVICLVRSTSQRRIVYQVCFSTLELLYVLIITKYTLRAPSSNANPPSTTIPILQEYITWQPLKGWLTFLQLLRRKRSITATNLNLLCGATEHPFLFQSCLMNSKLTRVNSIPLILRMMRIWAHYYGGVLCVRTSSHRFCWSVTVSFLYTSVN